MGPSITSSRETPPGGEASKWTPILTSRPNPTPQVQSSRQSRTITSNAAGGGRLRAYAASSLCLVFSGGLQPRPLRPPQTNLTVIGLSGTPASGRPIAHAHRTANQLSRPDLRTSCRKATWSSRQTNLVTYGKTGVYGRTLASQPDLSRTTSNLRGACPVTRLNTREKAAALW